MLTRPALSLAFWVTISAKEDARLSCSAEVCIGRFPDHTYADEWMNALKKALKEKEGYFSVSFDENPIPSKSFGNPIDINIDELTIGEVVDEFPILVLRAAQRGFDGL